MTTQKIRTRASLDNNQIDACKKIHERARYIRGRFLNHVAVIEREIALILTDYFCRDDEEKRELFFTAVITAPFFSLSSRKDLLLKIIKNDYPGYWKKYSQTLKRLDEIISFRNKLAHSVVDVSEEALARPLEKGVGFIEWKEGEPITEKDFDDWQAKANMISSCISDIKQLLPYKERSQED